MAVGEYWEKFTTLSWYAPEDTDTEKKKKERFLNGLHEELQCTLVVIPFNDLESLADAAIMMENKCLNMFETRKRKMMQQGGSSSARARSAPPARPPPPRAPAYEPRPNIHYAPKPSNPGFQKSSGGGSSGGYPNRAAPPAPRPADRKSVV